MKAALRRQRPARRFTRAWGGACAQTIARLGWWTVGLSPHAAPVWEALLAPARKAVIAARHPLSPTMLSQQRASHNLRAAPAQAAVTLGADAPMAAGTVCCWTLEAALVAHCAVRPYASRSAARVELASLVVSLLLVASAMSASRPGEAAPPGEGGTAFAFGMIAAHAVVVRVQPLKRLGSGRVPGSCRTTDCLCTFTGDAVFGGHARRACLGGGARR